MTQCRQKRHVYLAISVTFFIILEILNAVKFSLRKLMLAQKKLRTDVSTFYHDCLSRIRKKMKFSHFCKILMLWNVRKESIDTFTNIPEKRIKQKKSYVMTVKEIIVSTNIMNFFFLKRTADERDFVRLSEFSVQATQDSYRNTT